MNRSTFVTLCLIALVGTSLLISRDQQRSVLTAKSDPKSKTSSRTPASVGHPFFASPHSKPIAVCGDHVFVVNTPSDTVDVIDAKSRELVHRIPVGVDPVSIVVRPDGKEVWVSNHVSDSVSVIDSDPSSPTHWNVVATIQAFDQETKSTLFDEPVGIAFANNEKAYVALSSENEIAVIDVAKRLVTNRLSIAAQDPRSIMVQGDRLYVVPFESNNKTQLSGGSGNEIDGDLVTFDAWQHSIFNNNVLSLGHVVDIVKHPDVPDRDLFVFDTTTDELVETVDSLGTLLYGMTVDSKGSVFVAQTDARNHINGRSGTKKHGLAELENRAFLNQITKVEFTAGTADVKFFELEPLPPEHPEPGEAIATPFGIQVSDDDSTLVVTAAGSDKLVTIDAETGKVLGRITVGAVPRGLALQHNDDGQATTAWVYNAVANTVSVVDLSNLSEPAITGFVPLEDPTDREVKLGRTWFNDADASTTGTYSCASCHPDGHTDQLLWVLKTPVVSGGDQIMPRSTMPIRGLRDTAPFHWDGIPGDPYGGNNSANVHGSVAPNSDPEKPETSTRHLIDGGLASTMQRVGDKTINDEGKSGELTAAQRDDMAKFLLCVPYPPAQKRAFTNVVSKRANEGFELFHIKGHHDEKPKPNVCGDCHRMPFLVSTNTPGTGMDAPTWRGANDRFLILPQGRLNIVEFDFYRRVAEEGAPERKIWQFSWQGQPRFDPIWDMVLEGSTGVSGAFARQVTVSESTVGDPLTKELLDALELAAAEKAIVLEADGVLLGENPQPVAMQFVGDTDESAYRTKGEDAKWMTRAELIELASKGKFVGTFTACHGTECGLDHPQPAVWTLGPIEQQRGHQEFPILFPDNRTMVVSGRHVVNNAHAIVNGRRVDATVTLGTSESIEIKLASLPEPGTHLLQLQNPGGAFSNDFLFSVVDSAEAAERLREARRLEDKDIRDSIADAIVANDVHAVRHHLSRRQQQGRVNDHQPRTGSTPLSTAALHGRHDIAEVLIRRGANVNGENRDGNSPLHVAAFLCREDVIKLLIEKGGSVTKKNRRGETPIDVVSGEWTDELAGFYKFISDSSDLDLDLEQIQKDRPKIALFLQEKS